MINSKIPIIALGGTILVLTSSKVFGQTNPSSSPFLLPQPITVTATVPGFYNLLELTGWTSPYARVELTMGQLLTRATKAGKEGKFTFRTSLPRELGPFCLLATDVSSTTSHPLCIAPPPPTDNILIKEVIMPPTLKIEKGKILEGETIAASGYTTPNSEVIPYLFEENSRSGFLLPLISSVFAVEVPKPPIKSNQNGFYQFNLQTSTLGKNRVFTSSIFLNNPSPKSNLLVFDVFSSWQMLFLKLLAFIKSLFFLLLNFLISLKGIILLEIVLLAFILFLIFRKKPARKKEVVLKEETEESSPPGLKIIRL